MTQPRRHRLLSLLLTLSLIASGAVPGALHAAAAPAKGLVELVICAAEGGVRTILVDAHGNAGEPDEPCPGLDCPDCILAGLAALQPPAASAISRRALRLRVAVPGAAIARSRRAGSTRARAPPRAS